MKLKSLFIIFNIVLILIFLSLFVLPSLLLDSSFSASFWKQNIIYSSILLIILIIIDIIYFYFQKIISYIENDNCKNLTLYLKNKIYNKNKIKKLYLKLLLDCYYLTPEYKKIIKLRILVYEKNIRLYNKFLLVFSVFEIIFGNYEDAYSMLINSNVKQKEYGAFIEWFRGCCL